MSEIRIFSKEQNLRAGLRIKLSNNDFDYLVKVMRSRVGDELQFFNKSDGQWLARIILIEKKALIIELIEQQIECYRCPNISLAFAPVKDGRVDYIAAKATELGVRRFIPLITMRSVVNKINYLRFEANIKEALEQSQRLDNAVILPMQKLSNFLTSKDIGSKILILCDESGQGGKASKILPEIKKQMSEDQEIVLIVGPEGGFSMEEFIMMRAMSNLYSLRLGLRILRSDTACVAGLTLVQEFMGDF